MKKFEMNGKSYTTDAETIDVLRAITPTAKETKDYSAVAVVMELGLRFGRIKEA